MPNLTILSKEVRTLDGLYSLNDLHKASGKFNKHRPSLFMQNQQTKELIQEIEQSRNSCFAKYQGGKNQGTWVCKELVYSYAMWISAKFHLQVIRAFDQMVVNQQPEPKKLGYTPDRNIPLNDLIYEIAQLRGVSTEQVRIHYSDVFNSTQWTSESEIIAAAARGVLRRDLEAEIAKASPDMIHLLACARKQGLRLVDDNDYQSFQARLQMQQQELDKLIDEVMRLSRNNRSLLAHNIWS